MISDLPQSAVFRTGRFATRDYSTLFCGAARVPLLVPQTARDLEHMESDHLFKHGQGGHARNDGASGTAKPHLNGRNNLKVSCPYFAFFPGHISWSPSPWTSPKGYGLWGG